MATREDELQRAVDEIYARQTARAQSSSPALLEAARSFDQPAKRAIPGSYPDRPLADPLTTRVGRAAIEVPTIGAFRGPATRFQQGPLGGGGARGIGAARGVAGERLTAAPAIPIAQTGLPTPRVPTSPFYRQATGAALEETAPGTAVIQGRFPGQAAPETRAYTPEGIREAAGRVNVVPEKYFGGLLGIGSGIEEALSEARKAAAARGDFEAIRRSYLDTPEKKAAYNAQRAERRLLGAVGRLHPRDLPGALQAVGGLRKERAEGVLQEQKVQLGEQLTSMLQRLGDLDPTSDPTGAERNALISGILAAQGKTAAQPKQEREFFAVTDPVTGTPQTYSGITGQFQPQQAGALTAPTQQGLPPGVTAESARANAINLAKQNPQLLQAINQHLQQAGLLALTEDDLGT